MSITSKKISTNDEQIISNTLDNFVNSFKVNLNYILEETPSVMHYALS
jgi:hypothetical protein